MPCQREGCGHDIKEHRGGWGKCKKCLCGGFLALAMYYLTQLIGLWK